MSGKYFYAIEGVRHAPVAFDDLKSLIVRGELKRSDLIWTQGMPAWKSAGSFTELFEGLPPDIGEVITIPSRIAAITTPNICIQSQVHTNSNIEANFNWQRLVKSLIYSIIGILALIMLVAFLEKLSLIWIENPPWPIVLYISIFGLLSGALIYWCIRKLLK